MALTSGHWSWSQMSPGSFTGEKISPKRKKFTTSYQNEEYDKTIETGGIIRIVS
jgi:hypothetical protein